MGGVDKGLQPFRGRPLIAHVVERFSPQVADVLINANRNLAEYAAFGHPVIADEDDDYAGPLAGLYAGMRQAREPLIATAPCDSPFLPLDLVARLLAALQRERAEVAVAKTLDQPHPVFCLARSSLAPHLHAFLNSGQRKFDRWYAGLNMVEVHFDDQVAAFSNINTIDELTAPGQSSPPR